VIANQQHESLAAAAALLATGLMHVLLLSTPRPGQFFRWIMVLATLIAAITPFPTDAEQNTKIATAAIYVAIGNHRVADLKRRSKRRPRPAGEPPDGRVVTARADVLQGPDRRWSRA
jgi:Family of unknown function (DUF6069)